MEENGLRALLRYLSDVRYRFVTPTPATHARVIARLDRRIARDARDVLGWNLPFRRGTMGQLEQLLEKAGALHDMDGLRASLVRVSSLGSRLFLHSPYPTLEENAVFFGPDSYRFVALIRASMPQRRWSGARIVDIGGGAGVGAVILADLMPEGAVAMTDINPAAIRLARINAAAAGVSIEAVEGAGLADLSSPFDLITANPPYIVDAACRRYRDGGAMHGAQVSLDIARTAVDALAREGRFILYTGSAIVDGTDSLGEALTHLCDDRGLALDYREIDPDVFGEELDEEAYRKVERIALVAAVIDRR